MKPYTSNFWHKCCKKTIYALSLAHTYIELDIDIRIIFKGSHKLTVLAAPVGQQLFQASMTVTLADHYHLTKKSFKFSWLKMVLKTPLFTL